MMEDCCAPQWTDFTCSPQLPSDSFFEVVHEMHEPKNYTKAVLVSNLLSKEDNISGESMSETMFDDSLEQSSPERPNIAYFIPHHNKTHSVQETKQDNLSNAMENLELDNKSRKTEQVWNISLTELIPGSLKCSKEESAMKRQMPNRLKQRIFMSQAKKTVAKSFVENTRNNNTKTQYNTQKGLLKGKNKSVVKSQSNNSTENTFTEKRLSHKVVSASRRQSNTFKIRRSSLVRSQPKVLTYQYRRKSIMKHRRRSNQFVSLAEAVSKFQNETPQRFRTMSNKDMKPGPLMKVKRSPLKLTYPISPALRCKQRSRHNAILNQQEREKLQLEEMKKHQIKANPVPVNILKGPTALKKVVKKPTTVAEEFHLTQSKKTRHTMASNVEIHNPITDARPSTKSKEQECVASVTLSHSATSFAKKDSAKPIEDTVKSATFSFEARNKKFQIKKEEKLKILHDQEINKVKVEFHAKPAPKFTQPLNSAKEQNNKKRSVALCPFSFEERYKNLAKKKEELVKQMQEQDKKARMFHANPAPVFKPVTVHGLAKDKVLTNTKENLTKHVKSNIGQENKQPNIMNNSGTAQDKKKISTKEHNSQVDAEQYKTDMDDMDNKNVKMKPTQKVPKFELNTDKRAKERNEFEEKIRKKEQEFDAKRQEEEKNKLLKEKMERAELRKMAEVKAKPMPVYKSMNVLKSAKPPTSPHSPAWASRTKSKDIL